MIQRAFRYRIYPTAEQAERMNDTAGACRFVRNLALEQRRDFWRQALRNGVRLTYVRQARELTELRAQVPWLAAIHVTPLQNALRSLDAAFVNFFSGRAGFPAFRSKDGVQAFRHAGREIAIEELSAKWALIRIPKIGMVKLRLTRRWRGRILSATFTKDALGWHVSLGCEIEHQAQPSALPAVGIDRGIANTIGLSTGDLLSAPDMIALERRKRKAQRVLARRQRGSMRYRKQRQHVAALTAKIARARSHWRHEQTTAIARRFGLVALENLNTKGMTAKGAGKRGLNRSILEQGWQAFEAVLAYKLEERGGTLVKIQPAYTSQECSSCGVIDKRSRESQSSFKCRHCGFTAHADTNAAINILRRSTASVEATGCRADEARTHALAA